MQNISKKGFYSDGTRRRFKSLDEESLDVLISNCEDLVLLSKMSYKTRCAFTKIYKQYNQRFPKRFAKHNDEILYVKKMTLEDRKLAKEDDSNFKICGKGEVVEMFDIINDWVYTLESWVIRDVDNLQSLKEVSLSNMADFSYAFQSNLEHSSSSRDMINTANIILNRALQLKKKMGLDKKEPKILEQDMDR